MSVDEKHWECNCVPDIGPSHCHACSAAEGREVAWPEHLRYARGVTAGVAAAREAALRQIQLSSLIGTRPVDFEKGVLSAVAAIDALHENGSKP